MSGLGAAFSILMVGHSLFSFDGPAMLGDALRAGTGEGEVAAQIINGAPLKYNWEHSNEAEGVDARAALPGGAYNHLILTEAVPLDNHLAWSDTGAFAEAFAALALNANKDAHIWVQETWHSLNSGTGVAVEYDDGAHLPWRTRLEEDLPKWQGIVAELRQGHPDAADRIGIIPAGQALGVLSDTIARGEIAGLNDIRDLFGDDIHLNHMGHYFVAMVQYATLTGENPLGLPTDFADDFGRAFDTPDPDMARDLQKVAWAAVQSYRQTETIGAAAPVAAARTAVAATPAAPRGPPVLPAQGPADLTAARAEVRPGAGRLGIGLAAHKDWSTQHPFLDLMKSARPWIGHEPGRWAGRDRAQLKAEGVLDARGWPLRKPNDLGSIGTLILTDMPEAAQSLAGRYRLKFDGTGIIEVGGRASNVRYGRGEVRFDYTPGAGPVDIRIQRINPQDPVRNISVVKEEHAAAFDRGAIFNPDWLALMRGFDTLRLMDWMETNGSTQATWDQRPQPGDATWFDGIPLEVMIALANEVQAHPWFNIPHLADDGYVRAFAQMVEARLDPALTAHVEFSNEVWNWQFTQAAWADEMGQARWNKRDTWMQYYALRAAEVARIFSDTFAENAKDRLINIISTQTGWLGLETEVLTAPLVVADGLPAPYEAFDAYAITGYFGGQMGHDESLPMVEEWLTESAAKAQTQAEEKGLTGQALRADVARHRYDLARALAARELTDGAISGNDASSLEELITVFWPYHGDVARQHGLDLIVYEGGTHVVGVGAAVDNAAVSDFMQHFNYSAEVASLYRIVLEAFPQAGGQLYVHYADVQNPTKWGSWGALRHLDDSNPRWDALVGAK